MKKDLHHRLSDLRGGISAIQCIEIAMELAGNCGAKAEQGLYYVAEHMNTDLDALAAEISEN